MPGELTALTSRAWRKLVQQPPCRHASRQPPRRCAHRQRAKQAAIARRRPGQGSDARLRRRSGQWSKRNWAGAARACADQSPADGHDACRQDAGNTHGIQLWKANKNVVTASPTHWSTCAADGRDAGCVSSSNCASCRSKLTNSLVTSAKPMPLSCS